MVRQVFMEERFYVDDNPRTFLQAAFGSHPDLEEQDSVPGVNAAVARDGQKIRVVLDELLVGSYIEEIACDGLDDQGDQIFSRIPPEATPDDVAHCSPPELTNCKGENAMCIVDGSPIGVLDTEQDGAPDRFRMIRYEDGQLAVRLSCDGGDGTLGNADDIFIPLNQDTTFYNPSGNQLVPAGPCGFDCLGPALVINLEDGMKTGAECGLSFQNQVIDKDLNPVCAPPNGDITQSCTPGDTSIIRWTNEALRIQSTFPADGDTGLNIATQLLIITNASMDAASLADIQVTENGGAFAVNFSLSADDPKTIQGAPAGGTLTAGATYVVTIPVTVTDRFGGPLPQEFSFTFTTAP